MDTATEALTKDEADRRSAVQQLVGRLIHLAAEMAQGKGMPSPYRDDWPTCWEWRHVRAAAEKAEAKAKDWAVELRQIADCIR